MKPNKYCSTFMIYSACREYFVLNTKQFWYDAKAACEDMGATLATLTTSADVEKAAQEIGDKQFYWIGGHCPGCRPLNIVKPSDTTNQWPPCI